MIEAIDKSKNVNLDKFIYSLGIRYIGENISNLLAKEFVSINEFIKSSCKKEKLLDIDGLGPKAINSIYLYFSNNNNYKIVSEIIKILNIRNFKKNISNSFLADKNLVFTGTLSKFSREEAKHLAIQLGAKIASSVTTNTDYVIIGEKAGNKAKKAIELGVTTLNENQWIKIISS